jgi:hypothetical protein
MPNTTAFGRTKTLRWQNILIGFALTIALVMVAALIGSLIPAPAAALVLVAVAFLGVGALTMRLRPASKPSEPAIGAALLVLLLSILQLTIVPGPMRELPLGQVALSVVLSIAFAFSLAWLGARIAARGGMAAPRQDVPSAP